MAVANLAKGMEEELTCSLCMNYFSHPITLVCGHSFCRRCLLRNNRCLLRNNRRNNRCLLRNNRGEAAQSRSCPECKRTFRLKDFQQNFCLEKFVSIARALKPHLLKIKEDNTKCIKHLQDQVLFCEEDKALLCESCCLEHSGHTVRFIGEAADDSRDKLQKYLNLCWKETEKVESMLTEERMKEERWKESSQSWKENVMAEYRKLHVLLQDEEQRFLDMQAEQDSNHVKRIRESETKLSQHLQRLRGMIGNMEENFQKPNIQLLQVAGDSLTRCASLLGHRPETVPTPAFTIPRTLMWETLIYFKSEVTLDPISACPYLVVLEDLKTVLHAGYQQTVISKPNQFKKNIILGIQRFMSGKHYWEVDVGNSRQWTVGVCKESLSTDTDTFSSEDVFLLSYTKHRDIHMAMTTPPYFKHLLQGPICRVGILLDCDERTISFYDALEKGFIYQLPLLPYPVFLRPFFSPCPSTEEDGAIPMTIRRL